MLGTREHYLTDCLGQEFLFTSMPQADNVGAPRSPDIIACWTYARYTLEDIARSQNDPFHYRLLGLWLDVFREPWAQPMDLDGLVDDLAEAIASGEVLVYRHEDPLDAYMGSSGAGEYADSASGDKFKTWRPVDMENLSPEDAEAAKVLKQQGRDKKKVKEVLSSGHNFGTKELQPGDELYGLDSTDNKYPTKNPASPYWLDEAGYQDVKSKFYKDGVWDREGVKNYLALPCSNRADVIDTATVQEPHIAVESTVGKATEEIGYTQEDYSTGLMGKIMPGRGTQVAPNQNALSEVTRLEGTP